MKKTIIALVALAISTSALAKKVRFSVDMTGQTVSVNGVHLSGDMQDEAGFPADWEPNTILMQKEGSSNIFSVVVDIPAHRKYEYKFVNGDLFYESEIVPDESRVGYEFVDNRWIYIDSLANDTTILPALLFGGNAASGKKMVRFIVDMKKVPSINNAGVHIAGDFNNWNYSAAKMYSFVDSIFEYQAYADSGNTVAFKYINGTTLSDAETVPTSCAVSGNRTVIFSVDKHLDTVCYGACQSCSSGSSGIFTLNNTLPSIQVYPNPAKNMFSVVAGSGSNNFEVSLVSINGKILATKAAVNQLQIDVNVDGVKPGLYLVQLKTQQSISYRKIIIE